jgi:hypothetical protein
MLDIYEMGGGKKEREREREREETRAVRCNPY